MNGPRRHVMLAGLIVAAGQACGTPPDDVYLFDCAGRIQRIDSASATGPVHVSDIDSTLPDRVRDGCAIHAGWRDSASGLLMLVVQTQPIIDENDRLPTTVLALATPTLTPVTLDAPAPEPPHDPDRRAVATRLEAIAGPFPRSTGYLLNDGTSLLLQELAPEPDASRTRSLDPFWRAGAISLNQAQPQATGRYALFDVAADELRGNVVSTTAPGDAHRVVCFTPDGRVYLAVARHSLLVLDVMHPGRHVRIDDLALDLHWSTCASR